MRKRDIWGRGSDKYRQREGEYTDKHIAYRQRDTQKRERDREREKRMVNKQKDRQRDQEKGTDRKRNTQRGIYIEREGGGEKQTDRQTERDERDTHIERHLHTTT